ncbi:MAG: hypothetical protein HGA62_05270 [Chlorobiaceae bacterium]|nr:hypothetical protein [Chlorobiaceae bacterium]NTV60525.1 hypothetical protein [Chlorobiaceae bacterium]
MDFFDFIPFRSEFEKAYYGLTSNATHTSEKPVFSELKVRRFDLPAAELARFVVDKIEHWVGWTLKGEKTTVGGMTSIRAQVNSFVLLGMVIEVTFGLLEEHDQTGRPITTVNSKAVTQIESKGDLGESRRVIRMILSAMDHEFRQKRVNEEDYLHRIFNSKESAVAFQQIFDSAKFQNEKKPSGSAKSKPIEFRKKPVQTIQLKPAVKTETLPEPAAATISEKQEQGEPATGEVAGNGSAEVKPSKPKIMIITPKKPFNREV